MGIQYPSKLWILPWDCTDRRARMNHKITILGTTRALLSYDGASESEETAAQRQQMGFVGRTLQNNKHEAAISAWYSLASEQYVREVIKTRVRHSPQRAASLLMRRCPSPSGGCKSPSSDLCNIREPQPSAKHFKQPINSLRWQRHH
jgi:hypothetical protein